MNATQSHVTPEYLASQGLSQTFPERFFAKIKFTDSCWLWQAYRMPAGYGMIGRTRPRSMMLAHRASWILHFSPIPDGMWVLHDCPGGDNPSCVNPAHLWLGTDADNSQDAKEKGRTWKPPSGFYAGDKCGTAKLTWEKVRQIRSQYRQFVTSTIELANKFGVSATTIGNIVHNNSWIDSEYRPLPNQFRSIFSNDEKKAIKEAYKSGIKQYVLATQYGVSKQLISAIAGGHRRRHGLKKFNEQTFVSPPSAGV